MFYWVTGRKKRQSFPQKINPSIADTSTHIISKEHQQPNRIAIMAENNAEAANEMAASYDLIPKLLPHLDRHMIFPLLGFMGEQDRLTDQELAQARYDLLKNSNMTDF